MKFTLHSWSVHRHPATAKKPAYVHVSIRGYHAGLLRKNWKSEGYDIPLSADAKQDTNKELVHRAMKLSQNGWSVPWGMNFN